MSKFFKDLSLPAIVAGFLAVLVSYSGPLAIFFQAGASAGISTEMMTSWVWAISMGAAISGIILSIWLKAPVVTAWSAPGTALLVALFPELSLNEAIGAYITAAIIIFIIGVSGTFDTLVRAIPKGIAAGMMAGILFQFGVGAFTAIETTPALAIGMLVSYVAFRRLFPKYTLVLLLVAGVVLAIILEGASLSGVRWSIAVPQFIQPEWTLGSTLSLAIPLVLVSLTGQFLPGMAILQGRVTRSRPNRSLASPAWCRCPWRFLAVSPRWWRRLRRPSAPVRTPMKTRPAVISRVCSMGCSTWWVGCLPAPSLACSPRYRQRLLPCLRVWRCWEPSRGTCFQRWKMPATARRR